MIAIMIVSSCYILILNTFSYLCTGRVLTKDNLTFSSSIETRIYIFFVVVLVISAKSYAELKICTLLYRAI